MREFTGKVAVITGAASGMGLAYANRFAAEGMKVVLSDIEQNALDREVARLTGQGHDVLGVVTDVSKRESVQALADAALARYGKIHLVCNNAGVEGYLDGAAWEATDRDWQWTMGVNFYGVLHGVQVFMPILLAQGEEAHMVNTGSMLSITRVPNIYGVTKHAVLALSEMCYSALQQRNSKVGVSVLFPGTIATNLFRGSRNRPAELRDEVDLAAEGAGRELREHMHEVLSKGMPPERVADIVVEAVRNNQFYVLTDHEWDDQIKGRLEDILLGRNPKISGGNV